MKLYEIAVTNEPEEYLPKDWKQKFPRRHDVKDGDLAVSEVLRYLKERLKLIVNTSSKPPVLLLSGGIDSILIAAVLADLEPDTVAVTFHWQGAGEAEAESVAEVENATAVARQFELRHHVLTPDPKEFQSGISDVIRYLETTEPWEILAGYIYFSVDQFCQKHHLEGPLVSGAGADVLTLGGKEFRAKHTDSETMNSWADEVESEVSRTFTRNRFIPDFYERILSDPDNHFKVWQTNAAVDLARHLHPEAVRGTGLELDKKIFRMAAQKVGVPEQYCFAPKSPMQVSSGGFPVWYMGRARCSASNSANRPILIQWKNRYSSL